MGCLGVHFALTPAQERKLLKARNDEALMDVMEQIEEEEWDPEFAAETDKAWDAIHRCLGDGTLAPDGGTYPLNRCILGGRQLHHGDDYIISYKTADEVRDVAHALPSITEEWLSERYAALSATDYRELMSDDDFDYTWQWFDGLSDFYHRAAGARRAVIFTADQ